MAYCKGPRSVNYQHTHTHTHTFSSVLANDFASFFKGKIDTILAQLPAVMDNVVLSLPPCSSSRTRFGPFTDSESHRIIAKSPKTNK